MNVVSESIYWSSALLKEQWVKVWYMEACGFAFMILKPLYVSIEHPYLLTLMPRNRESL